MKFARYSWSAGSLLAGVIVAGLGIAGFLIPNHFIDGGFSGIAMLLAKLTGIPLPILIVVVNAPFVFIGYRHIGFIFAVKSALAIIGLAICLAVVPFPVVTSDKLLGSFFGGFFIGAGVGLAIRGGGVLDGTEVLAVILSKRTFATVGEVILGLNVVIFCVAAVFLGVESALYSALTYFAASKTIDYLLHGIEAYNGVMIFGFTHAAWFTLARSLPPIASTLSTMMVPIVGVFTGALWLGEVLHWQDWAAVLLMATAIVTVLVAGSQRPAK